MNKKSILYLFFAVIALTSCKKEQEMTFTSEEIMIDLGSSDKDVFQFVKVTDNAPITISGIDYDKVGSYQALFTSGDLKETRTVKVRADKLAGTYEFHFFVITNNGEEKETTIGKWLMEITKGIQYNQINISDSNTNGVHVFVDQGCLVLTLDGDKAEIPPYKGNVLFVPSSSSPYTYSFEDIQYSKLNDGSYGLMGFMLRRDCDDGQFTTYYHITFEKQIQ
ncbi:MAG: hypothetical protein II525_08955 [Bacteroidales bacterium]|nr:hypothetical protein [Bacteroidales bacterium]